jgi:hypothetical protein
MLRSALWVIMPELHNSGLPDLPGGGFTVIFVCGAGLILVVFFAVKELRFDYYRRRGIELFNERNYQAALRHLIQAEKLWMLRLSKQTMPSRIDDCKQLGRMLDLISEAAGHCAVKIEVEEYRDAIGEMECFFSNENRPDRGYSEIYSKLKSAQRKFRCNAKDIQV